MGEAVSCSVEALKATAGPLPGQLHQPEHAARWMVSYIGPRAGNALPSLPARGYTIPRGCPVPVDDAEHVLAFMGCAQFRVAGTRPD